MQPASTHVGRLGSTHGLWVCEQGRRHQVLFEGTDSWTPKPTYPQNLVSPRISATLFRKCLKMQNLQIPISRKRYLLKYNNFWGTSTADFSTAGTRPPVPPAFDAHVCGLKKTLLMAKEKGVDEKTQDENQCRRKMARWKMNGRIIVERKMFHTKEYQNEKMNGRKNIQTKNRACSVSPRMKNFLRRILYSAFDEA